MFIHSFPDAFAVSNRYLCTTLYIVMKGTGFHSNSWMSGEDGWKLRRKRKAHTPWHVIDQSKRTKIRIHS